MKDHAYLMLTKMDAQSDKRRLESAVGVLRKNFSDQFKHILPISALNAVKCRKRDGTIDKPGLANSGGQALISALMRDLKLSRQIAIDQAEVILGRFSSTMEP